GRVVDDRGGLTVPGAPEGYPRRYSFSCDPHVIDLGLRLADVRELDLQDEEVFDKGRPSVRRANLRENGATGEEIEFLLHRRGELDAPTGNQLVARLVKKIKQDAIRADRP